MRNIAGWTPRKFYQCTNPPIIYVSISDQIIQDLRRVLLVSFAPHPLFWMHSCIKPELQIRPQFQLHCFCPVSLKHPPWVLSLGLCHVFLEVFFSSSFISESYALNSSPNPWAKPLLIVPFSRLPSLPEVSSPSIVYATHLPLTPCCLILWTVFLCLCCFLKDSCNTKLHLKILHIIHNICKCSFAYVTIL